MAGSSPAMTMVPVNHALGYGSRLKAETTGLRVPRIVRQHADIDADLGERAGVFLVDVVTEDEIGIGVAMQPAIALDLVLELARAPTGIAEREDGVPGALAVGDRLEDIDGRGQADPVVDRQRGVG